MATAQTSQKVLDYVKKSGVLIAEAEKKAAEWSTKTAAAEKLIPSAVDALIANGRISEELREKAAASLADHSKTLEILASVAAHRNDAELSHLGSAVKTASAKRDSGYVGADRDDRESDRVLLERFGVR